jgi:hypothetical protein
MKHALIIVFGMVLLGCEADLNIADGPLLIPPGSVITAPADWPLRQMTPGGEREGRRAVVGPNSGILVMPPGAQPAPVPLPDALPKVKV